MEKILFDTNFLISCVRNKIDFISELENLFGICELVVPKQVLEEIDMISYSKRAKIVDRQAAIVAKQLLEKLKFKKIDLKTRSVDKGIIEMSEKREYIVATIDKELKVKLKKKGIKILVIKQKSRVDFD